MGLKPKTWEVLRMAVEEGVAYGYQRAHKHTDQPSEEAVKQAIEEAVLNAIGNWFHMDDENQ